MAVTKTTLGAADTVDTADLVDGAVSTPKLAADAVTAAKVLAGAIGASELAAGAVGPAELAAATAGQLRDITHDPGDQTYAGNNTTVLFTEDLGADVAFIPVWWEIPDPGGTDLQAQMVWEYHDGATIKSVGVNTGDTNQIADHDVLLRQAIGSGTNSSDTRMIRKVIFRLENTTAGDETVDVGKYRCIGVVVARGA